MCIQDDIRLSFEMFTNAVRATYHVRGETFTHTVREGSPYYNIYGNMWYADETEVNGLIWFNLEGEIKVFYISPLK